MAIKIIKKIKRLTLPNSSGFTLIEMIVSVGIFIIIMVVILETFLVSSRLQQKTTAVLDAQAEARFVLETITRKIRAGYIFYDHYGGSITNPEDEFSIVDIYDNGTTFFLEQTAASCPTTESAPCLKMDSDIRGNSTTTQYLTGDGLKIVNLDFYIFPTQDPFIPFPVTNAQPRVTIIMTIQSVGTRIEQIATAYLQTTVSTRYYKR